MILKRIEAVTGIARRLGLSWRVMPFLFALNILAIAFEAAGISMLLPIFEILRAGGSVDPAQLSGRHWDLIRAAAASIGVPVSLGVLLGVSFALICMRQLFKYWPPRMVSAK